MIRRSQRFDVLLLALAVLFASEGRAQTDTSTTPVKEGSLPVAIVLVETVAIGSGALARSETGARVVGTLQGLSGLTVLGIAVLSNRRQGAPEFMVPYGLGLLALSYYNFASASSGDDSARFWTNTIGFNGAVVAGVISSRLWRNDRRLSFGVGPAGVVLVLRF